MLGFGWSSAFIAGSTMLTNAISPAERPATQGLADLVMGLCGAGGGAVAGVIVDRMGYNQLGWVSAAIALFIVVLAVTGLRSRKARASADSVWPELDADARADRLAGFRNGVFPGALM